MEKSQKKNFGIELVDSSTFGETALFSYGFIWTDGCAWVERKGKQPKILAAYGCC